MRIRIEVVLTCLLVAGYATGKIEDQSPQIQTKKLNESLRLVLNHICSLSCGKFVHRNITPEELYSELKKHLEDYKRASDEIMAFCKANKIDPRDLFVEEDPIKLVNIFTDLKEDQPLTLKQASADPMQEAFKKAGLLGLGDWENA